MTVVPDILANSGGVAVSYLEWIQNRTGDYWDVETVHHRLRQRLGKASVDVCRLAADSGADLRCAAYALALRNFEETVLAHGTRRLYDGH